MLKRLRWQLTLLYALGSLALVVVVVAGSYALLQYYFQYTTDLALQFRMAETLQQYHLPVPKDLVDAQASWLVPGALTPLDRLTRRYEGSHTHLEDDDHEEDEDDEHESDDDERHERKRGDDHYDGQLASVFILPLSAEGESLLTAGSPRPPFTPDQAAYRAALQSGRDWRTVRLENGSRLRLFTYRTGGTQEPAVIQAGQLFDDEDRVLSLFLTGLSVSGTVVFMLLSLGGWLLSGRTIAPAQKAWDQQQAFVANASHELRTPLSIVRATADLHLRLPGEMDPAEGFRSVIQECDYMNRLVDNLLLLSRLDSRRLALERKEIHIDSLLQEVQAQMAPLAEEQGLSLKLGKSEGVLLGDPTRMRQVLLILIDNALRYTPPGGCILLEATRKGQQVIVRVADNGMGISAEHLPHVFERFYKVPREVGGEKSNGLGLSIAKGLIEAQGGRITLRSREGEGTEVSLIIPAAQ